MLRKLLRRCRKSVNFLSRILLCHAFRGDHSRCPSGQCAGFVKRDYPHTRQPFQRITLPHKASVLCYIPNGSHNRGRGRKDECARAENHQDRHGTDDLPRKDSCLRRRGMPPARRSAVLPVPLAVSGRVFFLLLLVLPEWPCLYCLLPPGDPFLLCIARCFLEKPAPCGARYPAALFPLCRLLFGGSFPLVPLVIRWFFFSYAICASEMNLPLVPLMPLAASGMGPLLVFSRRQIKRQVFLPASFWRRTWDSNPRGCYTLLDFQSSSLAARSILRIICRVSPTQQRVYHTYRIFASLFHSKIIERGNFPAFLTYDAFS